jgi:serine/threonine-protein kinase
VVDGRWRIQRRLGTWSLGTVYSAVHRILDRPVELYVLRSEFCEDIEPLGRFMAKARDVAKLGHPAVLATFDSGWIDDEWFFYVNEPAVTASCRELLDDSGRLPWPRVWGLAVQLIDILETFHRQDILHCALEPANILVGREGEQDVVRIRNFGTNEFIDAILDSPTILGEGGDLFGSPAYLAPERARRLPPTQQTDVYGVAACIYELLTGSPPFEGQNFQQIVSRVRTDSPPAASDIAPDNVPGAVDEFLRRGLASSPSQRFHNMSELAAALRALPPTLPPKEPAAGAPARTVADRDTPVVTHQGTENDVRPNLVAVGPSPLPGASKKNPLRQTLLAPHTERGAANNLRRTQLAPDGQFMGLSATNTPAPLTAPVVNVAPPKSRTPLIVGGVIAAGLLMAVAIIAVGGRTQGQSQSPDITVAKQTVAPQPQPEPVARPEAQAEPEPPIDPADLPPALQGPEIRRGFKSAEQTIATDCGRHPGTNVEIVAKISGRGRVVSAEPAKGHDSALSRCVIEAVTHGARFAPFAKSSDTFRWTYRL